MRQGGGRVSIFGLPLFLIGIFTTLVGFGVPPIRNASGALIIAIDLAFLGFGGALVFGRRWAIFDTAHRCVIRSWGLLIPMRQKERSLSEFKAVVMAFVSESESADSYPVRLQALTGKDFEVSSSTNFAESREQAEFLARFLGLDLVDRSTDHELIISPERASETLQERLRSSRSQPEHIIRPIAMRSEVNESSGNARIAMPGHRLAAIPFVAGAVIPIGIAVFLFPLLLQFFRGTDRPDPWNVAPMVALIFAFGVLPALGVIHAVLSAIRSRTVVTASPAGIQIERRGAWRTQTTWIPAGDILALDYSTFDTMLQKRAIDIGQTVSETPGITSSPIFAALKKLVASKGIIVKSRFGLFFFGEGLPGEELRYLLSIIVSAMA